MTSGIKTKILLVGAGALGSVYAWRLQATDRVEVTAVCRSNYESVKANGFVIKSKGFGDHVYKPTNVVRTVEEAVDGEEAPFDFVIFCTKALPNLGDNSGIISAAVKDPRTIIILIQNGVGIEEPFAQRYPDNPILSVIAYIDSSQPSDGVIEHGFVTVLVMGLFNVQSVNYDVDDVKGRVEKLNEIWTENGVTCMFVDEIQRFRWSKLVWNSSFNTVSVVSGGNNTVEMLNNPYCKKLIRDIMLEIYKLGEAVTGSPLPPVSGMVGADEVIAETENRGIPVIPSMLMDYKAKRPMEHAVILKNPIDMAKKVGVDVPCMESVYAMLVMIEHGYSKESKI